MASPDTDSPAVTPATAPGLESDPSPSAAAGHTATGHTATTGRAHTPPGLLATLRANGWTPWHALAMAALIALGVLATLDGWADLLFLAVNDPESSHILLVPLVVGWLLWLRWQRLTEITPTFSLIGPAFIVLGWGVYEYGYYENIRVAGHIAAVALLVGAVLAVAGGRLFWKLLPVWGVLLFAIPVPYRVRMPISIPLQRYTAQIGEHILGTFGVEITRQGSVLTINDIDVGVAEACNGMRMVFAVFLITYLLAFIKQLHPITRLALLVLAPVIALACNLVRLVPTVLLYGHASEETAEMFHDLSGWAVIALAFVAMLGVLKLIDWMLVADETPTPHVPATRRAGDA